MYSVRLEWPHGQHEAVAAEPVRVGRVVPQRLLEQQVGRGRQAHRRAGVAVARPSGRRPWRGPGRCRPPGGRGRRSRSGSVGCGCAGRAGGGVGRGLRGGLRPGALRHVVSAPSGRPWTRALASGAVCCLRAGTGPGHTSSSTSALPARRRGINADQPLVIRAHAAPRARSDARLQWLRSPSPVRKRLRAVRGRATRRDGAVRASTESARAARRRAGPAAAPTSRSPSRASSSCCWSRPCRRCSSPRAACRRCGCRGRPCVGGTLAAGSANAINCYVDRDIDKLMHRTRRRPLPSGEVAPRAALDVRDRARRSLSTSCSLRRRHWLAAAARGGRDLSSTSSSTRWCSSGAPAQNIVSAAARRAAAGADRLGRGHRLARLAAAGALRRHLLLDAAALLGAGHAVPRRLRAAPACRCCRWWRPPRSVARQIVVYSLGDGRGVAAALAGRPASAGSTRSSAAALGAWFLVEAHRLLAPHPRHRGPTRPADAACSTSRSPTSRCCSSRSRSTRCTR